MREVKEIIKEYRKKSGLTQPQLGTLINSSQQYVSLVENNKSPLSEDSLKELKKHMPQNLYEELEEAVYLEKMPKAFQEKIKARITKRTIPYYKNIKASAGNGYFNLCDSPPDDYLEIKGERINEHCVALNIQGDSMYPELQDKDLIVIDCSNTIPNSKDFYVVKYRNDIFAKRLIIENEEILGLRSVNPLYQDIELRTMDSFIVLGKIIKIFREY
ncbi:MAG: XRE family transcriptional regulator [Cetobacterium sp.]